MLLYYLLELCAIEGKCVRVIKMKNLKWCKERLPWPTLKYYPSTFVVALRIAM
jgi:hypothetical protein